MNKTCIGMLSKVVGIAFLRHLRRATWYIYFVKIRMNMAVAVGAFPVTGQPLPLVSRGGTSLFITSTYIGMILSVSHTAKRKPEYAND